MKVEDNIQSNNNCLHFVLQLLDPLPLPFAIGQEVFERSKN